MVNGNYTGRSRTDALNDQSFSLLMPPGLITRADRGSTLDMCFGSRRLAMPSSVVMSDNVGSDHLPIIVGFGNYCSLTGQMK